MIKIGYGKANYAELITRNFYYIDRTNFIEKLESLGPEYLLFLRPRRFGKSLWISTLEYYYGKQYKEQFQTLFGNYYIGKNPTSFANTYLILRFNFSGLVGKEEETLKNSFLKVILDGLSTFYNHYPEIITKEQQKLIDKNTEPSDLLRDFFRSFPKGKEHIYLLIDEYDHFANELISFDFTMFQKVVTRNGWVRKCYEVFKIAAGDNIIQRMFITGVSPIMMDSLTSGFNISNNFSTDIRLHDLMGFTPKEVENLLILIGVKEANIKSTLALMKKWYNGYLFHYEANERLYNANSVLYFADKYIGENKIPYDLLDINIATDYSKIRNVFKIKNQESANFDSLHKLLYDEPIFIELTKAYSFEQGFSRDDLLSLLYYMGFLTIKEMKRGKTVLQIPNLMIHKLYFNYFISIIQRKANMEDEISILSDALDVLIYENNPMPLVEIVSKTIKALSLRDDYVMDEKHIQAIFFAFLNIVKYYDTKSEYEVEKQYYDIYMRKNSLANDEVINDFLFEFKFEKKVGKKAIKTIDDKTVKQVKRYLAHEELQKHPNLHAWRIFFVGHEVKVCQEVTLNIIQEAN